MKYDLPNGQGEILPNKLGLKSAEELALAEFEGFVLAEIKLTEQLTPKTVFNCAYICKIHRLALGHVYGFAGKYRTVNMSKGGFPFPAAMYLEQTMSLFEDEVLAKVPSRYDDRESLMTSIAIIHAELLFIHPFREGNGRTARVLANLMARQQGFGSLNFSEIAGTKFQEYVHAIQNAAHKNYTPMIEFIREIFPV
ncbi:MAG: Fic family protein [Taibaiella sp.]|nr:Fic family protein [Taibaiella sp.]